MIAPEMQKLLGQPVIVGNKAGASGVVSGSYAAPAAPDGYTLLVSGIFEVQNLFYIHVPITPDGKIANGPSLVLAVVGTSPFESVADLMAYAKANPSKTNIATTGPATSPAIALSQLNVIAGTKMAAIVYQDSGPAAAGRRGWSGPSWLCMAPEHRGHAKNGQVPIFAVATAKRVSVLPNVPTLEELGYKNINHSAFVGLRAQIRQVGENLCAALAAVGATLEDLVKTTTFVTDIDEFFKHVDLRASYLGSALPTSTTVEVRRLSHPDLMVEIEAIAMTDP